MKESRSDFFYMIFVYIILIFAGFITLYPFIYVLSVSISEPMEFLKKGVWFLPRGFSIESYRAIFNNSKVWLAYYNTIIYTVSGTFLGLMMVFFAAYALSKKRLFGRKVIMNLIIFTMYFSGGLIPGYILIIKLGLYNTRGAIVIPAIVSTYFIILARTFIDSLPGELEESARIDGANDVRILFSIILPLSAPILSVLGLYFGVAFWNTYFSAIIYLTDNTKHPIQVYLAQVIVYNEGMKEVGRLEPNALRQQSISQQLKYSLIIMGILPIMCVYPFIQKHLVKGMLLGSLKG